MDSENSGTEQPPTGIPNLSELQEAGAVEEEEGPQLLEKGEAVMAVSYPWRREVGRSFAEAIRDYPGVECRADFRLLATIVMSVRHDDPDQHIAIPFERIAECMGEARDIGHRNQLRGENATGEVLTDFLSRVLPEVELIPHDPKKGLARELVGVPQALSDEIVELRDDAFSQQEDEEQVYLDDPVREAGGYEMKKQAEKNQEEWIKHAVREPQKRLLWYLHRVSDGRASRKYKPDHEDTDAAYSMASDMVKGKQGSLNKRFNALNQLSAIVNDPVPRYLPSYTGNTVRVFTSGYSLCTINKSLRRVLQPDWIELDLASAQLAIVAQDWGLSEVGDFLGSGGSIWDSLYDFMGWAEYRWGVPRKGAKPALKKGLYSAVFGAGKERIRKLMFSEYVSSADYPGFLVYGNFLDRIFEHPLIKELMRSRKEQLRQIKKDGGAEDVFGETIKLTSGTNARSVLAQLAQAQELQLLLPALEVAETELSRVESKEGSARFWIMLWQHDGFSIRVRDKSRRSTVVNKFQKAVNGSTGPYQTELEVDYPEEEFAS